MKVAKERFPFPLPIRETVEVSVQRVGEIPSAASRVERVGGAIQLGAMLTHEVLPGPLVTHGACTCQRQILEVQRGKVALEIARARPFAAEDPVGACRQGVGKDALRQMPSVPLRPLIQARNQGVVNWRRWHAQEKPTPMQAGRAHCRGSQRL